MVTVTYAFPNYKMINRNLLINWNCFIFTTIINLEKMYMIGNVSKETVTTTKDALLEFTCNFSIIFVFFFWHFVQYFISIRSTSKTCLFPVRAWSKFFIPGQPENLFYRISKVHWACVIIFYPDFLHSFEGRNH